MNAKHLACQYCGDDAFDWDQGYRGKLQFLVAQQDPDVAEETNGFEGDNDPLALTPALEPRSEPTIYNATLCGKGVDVDKEQYGILLRRSTKANIFNTIVTGFESGLDVRDPDPEQNISSSIFSNLVNDFAYAETSDGTGILQDDDGGFDEIAFLSEPDRKNREEDPGIPGCFDPSAPVFGPATSLTKDAVAPPGDFFDSSAAFIGAFKDASDTWATSGSGPCGARSCRNLTGLLGSSQEAGRRGRQVRHEAPRTPRSLIGGNRTEEDPSGATQSTSLLAAWASWRSLG